jgi:hypothetical protein
VLLPYRDSEWEERDKPVINQRRRLFVSKKVGAKLEIEAGGQCKIRVAQCLSLRSNGRLDREYDGVEVYRQIGMSMINRFTLLTGGTMHIVGHSKQCGKFLKFTQKRVMKASFTVFEGRSEMWRFGLIRQN